MSVKLLTDHHLEFLSLKGNCRGSSESTLVKMPHFWKSHVCFAVTVAGNVQNMKPVKIAQVSYGPRREKTCLWGFRQSEFQTGLLSYRD